MAENVLEFLEWASRFFEISICSLGDQQYVDQVVYVLDPQRTLIRGVIYSARTEHNYYVGLGLPKSPPKNTKSLYAWCDLIDEKRLFLDPIIIDDNPSMWPMDQRDNLIVVKDSLSNPVWNVNFIPIVKNLLDSVRYDFFRQAAEFEGISSFSPVYCYKEILRGYLSFRIAEKTHSIDRNGIAFEI